MTAPAAYSDPTNAGHPPGEGPLRPGGVSQSGTPTTPENNLPSTTSAAAKRQAPALAIVRDLEGGNERVKLKGETYLPRNPAEDLANYRARLARSVFFNVFGRTVEGLTGMVFAKDPMLGEDVPPIIKGSDAEGATVEGQWENIDNAGTHGDVFCRDQLQDALVAGHNAILVEYPRSEGMQFGAEAEVSGVLRPYWVPIKKDNIVSWRTENIGGRAVLTQLVLKECVMVPDGLFGEKEQTRYRVFRNEMGAVSFQLLGVTEDEKVVLFDEGDYPTQDEIPVAEVITSGRKSLFESQPPLLDLAYLNIAHYQEWSDARNARHLTGVPFLFTAGIQIPEGEHLSVGPSSTLSAPNSDAKAAYVAASSDALSEMKGACDDLKADMGTLGLSMLAPQKRAAETAEAKRLDARGSDSALGVTARGLQDGIERALYFHARYLKLPSGGSIQINRNFDEPVMDAATMAAYADLADKIDLPLEVILDALVQGGRLPQDTDVATLAVQMTAARAQREAQRLQEQQDRLSLAMGAGQFDRAAA